MEEVKKEQPLPIAGMKVTPYMWHDPLMAGAYLAHLSYIVGRPEARAEFKADKGHDLERVLCGRGIEAMVDKTTGYDKMVVAAFADWVTENYWGVDGVEPPPEQ